MKSTKHTRTKQPRGALVAAGAMSAAIALVAAAAVLTHDDNSRSANPAAQHLTSSKGPETVRVDPASVDGEEDLFAGVKAQLAQCLERHDAPALQEGISEQDRTLHMLIRQRCGMEKSLSNYAWAEQVDANDQKADGVVDPELARLKQSAEQELAQLDEAIAAARRGEISAQPRSFRPHAPLKTPRPEYKEAFDAKRRRQEQAPKFENIYVTCMAGKSVTVASVQEFKAKYVVPHLESDGHTVIASTPELEQAMVADDECYSKAWSEGASHGQSGGR